MDHNFSSAKGALRWVENYNRYQKVEARVIELLSEGLPDDAILGDHEVEAHFRRACEENNLSLEAAAALMALDIEQTQATFRRALDLLGVTAAGRRRFGEV